MSRFIDETNKIYGRFTLIERVANRIGVPYYKCLCVCGNTSIVSIKNLRSGSTKSCGCLRKEMGINEIGNVYERLTVVERVENTSTYKDKNGVIYGGPFLWRCKCVCGNEVTVSGYKLRSGHTKSCGCIQKELIVKLGKANKLLYGEAAKRQLFGTYVRNAKNRSRIWDISEEDFFNLTSQPCHYCGVEPQQISKGQGKNGDYTYIGLDRINNSLGYLKDNVCPCCRVCNYMKRTLTYNEFLNHITKIVNKHREECLNDKINEHWFYTI